MSSFTDYTRSRVQLVVATCGQVADSAEQWAGNQPQRTPIPTQINPSDHFIQAKRPGIEENLRSPIHATTIYLLGFNFRRLPCRHKGPSERLSDNGGELIIQALS